MLLDAGFERQRLAMDSTVMTRDRALSILQKKTSAEQFDYLLDFMETQGPSIQQLEDYEKVMGGGPAARLLGVH
jgi:hypothetical protein